MDRREKYQEKFIKKASAKFKNKFDYSQVYYTRLKDEVKIICPNHNEFYKKPSEHLKSVWGCPKCAKEKRGWGLEAWKEHARESKYFDSFKVYIIECWNDEEMFYKIGVTYFNVWRRFFTEVSMPYEYKLLKEIKGEPQEIIDLESKLKGLHRGLHYIPKITFSGSKTECFSKLKSIKGIIMAKEEKEPDCCTKYLSEEGLEKHEKIRKAFEEIIKQSNNKLEWQKVNEVLKEEKKQ